MQKKIHKFFDLMLKIIVYLYKEDFLRFIGIDEEIKEILEVEIQTQHKKYVYLDFLCLLANNTICHIEFQYKKPTDEDFKRFFKYNISSENRYGHITETLIFRFCSMKKEQKTMKMGKSKTYNMRYFYLGSVNFKEIFRNINIKVNTYTKTNKVIKLTAREDLGLLLICLVEGFEKRAEMLKKICKLIEIDELFERERFGNFKYIIKDEMEHLLSDEEIEEIKNEIQKDLLEKIDMSPQALHEIAKAYDERTTKDIALELEESRKEGITEGRVEGIKQGEERIIKKLKKEMSDEKIAQITEIPLSQIKKI